MFQEEIKAGAKALRQYHAWYIQETWRRLPWLEQSEKGGGVGDERREGTGHHVQDLSSVGRTLVIPEGGGSHRGF